MRHQRRLEVTEEDLDLIEEYYVLEARQSLWAYRQYMDPDLVKGWWAAEVSKQFQLFYERLKAGLRPKMLLEAPPQHGKTRGLQDAISWMAGKNPDLKTIYASFSDDLGDATNKFLQRRFDDHKYRRTFPGTLIASDSTRDSGNWARNSTLLEFVGRRGSFRNATVQGQVTGKSLDLGVVDDPLKGREAAQSPTIRKKTWDWLMDDFFSRFSEYAGFIMTMTRWHVDDPGGRFVEHFPDAIVLKYPAMWREPKPGERNDAWDPRKVEGMPLFPEYKSRAFLLERKKAYTQSSWESLYQQSPIIGGGGMFPIEKFKYVKNPPSQNEVKKSVRYWDKAGTEGGGAYSCGCLMHLLVDGRFVVSDVVRGQWSSWDRERWIKSTADKDTTTWGRVEIWVEQEPGSGGKESAERTISMLRGYPVYADKVTGSKEIRAEPYAAQVQGGNVALVIGKWNAEFTEEHEVFPTGKYKDQVDAAAGACIKLTERKYKYDSTLSWVGV